MEKRIFIYSGRIIELIWMLVLSVPFIWFIPELLDFLRNPYYWIVNTTIMCAWVYVLWIIISKLPGTSKAGSYYKEDDITIIEYGKKKACLFDVTEIFLCKSPITRRVILLIRNNGEKIQFLSERLEANYSMVDTDFYLLYVQVLEENPHLVQEKDIWGEPIEYFYKRSKD